MAGLSLNPNPAVLVTQAGLFLASMHFVKSLMVEPYLKVKAQRDKLTIGDKDEAKSLLVKNEAKLTKIETSLKQATVESLQQVRAIQEKANAEKDRLLAAAQAAASQQAQSVQTQIQSQVEQSLKELPGIVGSLSEACFNKVVQ